MPARLPNKPRPMLRHILKQEFECSDPNLRGGRVHQSEHVSGQTSVKVGAAGKGFDRGDTDLG